MPNTLPIVLAPQVEWGTRNSKLVIRGRFDKNLRW